MADEVTCTVTGLTDKHISMLVDEYAEFVPGFKFMPLYKMGAWDGRTNFFTKKGRTYQSVLPTLVPRLLALGYRPKLVDNRAPLQINVAPIDKEIFAEHGITLREHQVDGVNAVFDNGHKGVILACTGSGKTNMLAALSKTYESIGFRTITIVPSRDLIRQNVETYVNLKLDVGAYSGTEKNLDHQHIVSTWQALQHNPAVLQAFQVVMIDEAHGIKGATISKLLVDCGANIPVRIGCTGTLPKAAADYKSVFAGLGGEVVYTVTAAELQAKQLLATCHITQMIMQDSRDPYKDKFAEYDHEKKALVANVPRNKWIADFLVDLASARGNTMILVSSIPVGKKLQKLIGDDKSIFIYGKDDDETRKAVYDSFGTNDNVIVIANVQIAAVGLSIDRIFNLVVIDLGKAFTRVIQSIGRALRMASDKAHADIFDISTNYSFGSHHAATRLKYYKEAQYKYDITKIDYK